MTLKIKILLLTILFPLLGFSQSVVHPEWNWLNQGGVAAPTNDGSILIWGMNSNSNPTPDTGFTPGTNDGINVNTAVYQIVSNRIDGHFEFENAGSQYFWATDPSQFTFADAGTTNDTPFTIAFDAKIINAGLLGGFVSKFNGGNDNEWEVLAFTSEWYFRQYSDGANAVYITRKAPVQNAGVWQRIVCISDGTESAAGMSIYSDSLRVDNANDASGTYVCMTNQSSTFFNVGRRGTTEHYLVGFIDRVEIYTNAQTEAWVTNDYIIGATNKGMPLFLQTNSENTIYSDCIFYMTAEDSQGTVVKDHSTNRNNITLGGGPAQATKISDGIRGSLSFDGGDTGTVSDNDSLDVTTGLTVIAWLTTRSTGAQAVVAKDDESVGSRCYGLQITNPDKFSRFVIFEDDTTFTTLEGTNALGPNTTNLVACTYEFVASGSSIMRNYFDGVQEAIATNAVGPIQTSSEDLGIGYRTYSGSPINFNGNATVVAMWNRVLSSNEIWNINLEGY